MAFDFNKVLNSAKSAVKNVGGKAQTAGKSVNLKAKISKEKSEIEKLKASLGAIVWDKIESGEIACDDFNEICEDIRTRLANIVDLEKSMEALKEKKEEVEEACAEACEEVEEVVAETFSEEAEKTEE